MNAIKKDCITPSVLKENKFCIKKSQNFIRCKIAVRFVLIYDSFVFSCKKKSTNQKPVKCVDQSESIFEFFMKLAEFWNPF